MGAGREGRLAGAHEHDAAVELRLHRLGHLSHGRRAVLGLADVLLHFVEHDDGVRQLTALGQGTPRGLDELLGRDVGRQRGELSDQKLAGRLDVGGEAPIGRDERFGDDRTDVQVVQLVQPALAGRFDRPANAREQPLLAQPEAEPRLGVLRGPAAGTQQNLQHAVADVVDTAAEQRPRGSHG